MTQHLLVAHGSPDPRHAHAVHTLAHRLTARGVATEAAFLEHSSPHVTCWLADHIAPVTALGLFLAPGYHVRVDLPRVLGAARGDVHDLGPLGTGDWLHPVLDDLVIGAGGSDRSPVLLVPAGSSSDSARRTIETLADRWAATRTGTVHPAHAPGDVDAAAADVVVVPLLLAPGVLSDRVMAAARGHGLRCTRTLSGSPRLVDAVATRLMGADQRVASDTSRESAR